MRLARRCGELDVFPRASITTPETTTRTYLFVRGEAVIRVMETSFFFNERRESVRVTRRQIATVRRTAIVFLLHQELGEQAVVPLGRAIDWVQRVEIATPQVEVLHPTLLAPADELRELQLGPVVARVKCKLVY